MKYKLEKGQIVESDFTKTYNPEDYKNTLKQIEKRVTELEAQRKIYDAKADNVARNHPHVLKIDEEMKNAIWLYHENFVASKISMKNIRQLKKDASGIAGQMKEITQQTGYEWK